MSWGTWSSTDWQTENQHAGYHDASSAWYPPENKGGSHSITEVLEQRKLEWHDVWDFCPRPKTCGPSPCKEWEMRWAPANRHEGHVDAPEAGGFWGSNCSDVKGGGKVDRLQGKGKNGQALGKGGSLGKGGHGYHGEGRTPLSHESQPFVPPSTPLSHESQPFVPPSHLFAPPTPSSLQHSPEINDAYQDPKDGLISKNSEEKATPQPQTTQRFELQTQNWIVEEEEPKSWEEEEPNASQKKEEGPTSPAIGQNGAGECAVFSMADDDEPEGDDALDDWYSGSNAALRKATGKKAAIEKGSERDGAAREARKSLQAQMLAKIRAKPNK